MARATRPALGLERPSTGGDAAYAIAYAPTRPRMVLWRRDMVRSVPGRARFTTKPARMEAILGTPPLLVSAEMASAMPPGLAWTRQACVVGSLHDWYIA